MADWTDTVLDDIRTARVRQDAKWGVQSHPPEWWLAVAAEEFGALAQRILADQFGSDRHGGESDPPAAMRKEAVQLAAVLVAFAEHLDCRDAGVAPIPSCPTFSITEADIEAGRFAASEATIRTSGPILAGARAAARATIESFLSRKGIGYA